MTGIRRNQNKRVAIRTPPCVINCEWEGHSIEEVDHNVLGNAKNTDSYRNIE